jgi:hypothetical protein
MKTYVSLKNHAFLVVIAAVCLLLAALATLLLPSLSRADEPKNIQVINLATTPAYMEELTFLRYELVGESTSPLTVTISIPYNFSETYPFSSGVKFTSFIAPWPGWHQIVVKIFDDNGFLYEYTYYFSVWSYDTFIPRVTSSLPSPE